MVLKPPAFRYEWAAAEIALDDESGDQVDVCLLCGALEYVRGGWSVER